MQITLSHPSGNANVRAALAGLNEAGLLHRFFTSIASFPGSLSDRLSRIGPLAELRRREFDPELRHLTTTFPWREAGRVLAGKLRCRSLIRHESGPLSLDAVYRVLDYTVAGNLSRLSSHHCNAVYAYEDGALETFKTAGRLGLKRYYDLPIGYWRAARRFMEPELTKRPHWACTMSGFADSPAKLARKDSEIELADRIYVASSFTAETLGDFAGKTAPVEIIPYGFPQVREKAHYRNISSGKLRVLYVGSLSQRKGLAYLIEAAELLKNHLTLTIVGNRISESCAPLNAALRIHEWKPSLSNLAILDLMQTHDILAFPSLFEGFGLVISEAMSQGTPVITTERTAGRDIIKTGDNGWLIEAGVTSSLVGALERILSDYTTLRTVGESAMETARQRPWSIYGRELAESLLRNSA